MDQLKVFLKQVVKYRFWITTTLAVLFVAIGYVVGSGPIIDATKKQTDTIEGSAKKVAGYTSPGIPNRQYAPMVKEKTDVVSVDVVKAWEKLYGVQAPLLTWPDRVKDRFQAWGRKWPEDVDKGAVQAAIGDYVFEYEKAVDATYAKVNPWDYVEGKGIVVVPEKTAFLRPYVFDPANLPKLGKVWAAQERLWIQGTLLDAVAKINGSAKSWDSAVVKQINDLDIGSPTAQDQKSAAKGETVETAPSLDPEGSAAPVDTSPMAQMMGGMGGSSSGGAQAEQEVYHLKTDSTQYTVLPVRMVAMVDQNRLNEFLVGLENSPMAIQVTEFELVKPMAPVAKPIKGDTAMNGMRGMEGGMMGLGRGYGGAMGGYPPGMMMNSAAMANEGGKMMGGGGYPGMMNMPGMMGGGATAKAKTGIDNRSKEAKKKRDDQAKAYRDRARASDMYYDVVEVTVYGQARFYNPPPAPAAAEPSASTEQPAAADAAKPADADPAKPADAPKPDSADPGKPADAPKTDDAAKKAEPAKAAEAPKDGEPKAADPGKPADAPKAETKPADAPKAEAPKAPDATKPADAPKADAPKAEAPKTAEPAK